jgi:DnaJ-class molecular chaperone
MKTCTKCGGLGNISGDLDDKGYIIYHVCDKCNGKGELYPHEEDDGCEDIIEQAENDWIIDSNRSRIEED